MIKQNYFQNLIKISAVFIVVFLFGFFNFCDVQAASLYLTSSSNKVTIGSLVTVNLLLNTQGKTINNAEATLQFSNDLIEIISVKGSLFSLWVESPSFSNSSGRISFNGGIPDPGYSGGGAKILTIVARAKKAGTASFLFGDATVRENDGLGTDVLTGQSPVSFSIASNAIIGEAKSTTAAESSTGLAPSVSNIVKVSDGTSAKAEVSNKVGVGAVAPISSLTYPNQDSWYSATTGVIKWNLPNKVDAVQTLIDHNPNSTPTIKYYSAIFSKNISGLEDGIWYFHVRYLTGDSWSKISHYKIQVDSTPPTDFAVSPVKNNNYVVGLKLSANDTASGIDYYVINIDNLPSVKVLAANAVNIIPWPETENGTHQISAAVYDLAGNKTELKLEVSSEKLVPVANVAVPDNIIAEKTEESHKPVNNFANSNYSILFNLLKLIIALILLFGWYKYILLKSRLFKTNKRAKRLSMAILLEKADKNLSVLEKAKKLNKLSKNEEKSLASLRDVISNIDSINNHK